MRIISGTHGGRRIQPPAHMPHTRPTTDIAKEGLFNTLQHSLSFEGIHSLDLFGGTGSISYELASRGAASLTIIEQDPKMFDFIKKTSHTLGFDAIKVIKMEVFRYMHQCQADYDFIFAGPPYALGTIDEIPDIIFQRSLLRPEGIFVLEHTPRNNYEKHPFFRRVKNYGTTLFSFFALEQGA